MTPITLPKSSFPGPRQEARGCLTNCFAEPDGEDGDVRWKRDAGITPFGTATGSFRGFIAVPGVIYAVFGTTVYQYSSAGGAGVALTGTLPGERPVICARNDADIPDIVIVAPGDGVFIISGSAVLDYPDPDVGQPNSVSIFKSFFIFTYGDGTVRSSDPNSTNINTLNNATAEYRPDTLYRSIPVGGVLLLMGSSSIELWGGTVNDTGFPYSFMQGIDRGLIGPYAVSGYQEGFGGGIVFVGDDGGTYLFNSSPTKISPPDLDRLVARVADKSTIEVMTFAHDGHLWAVVQCDAWSWAFDLNTQKWHVRKSYLQDNWRATQAVRAFDKWVVGDRLTGSLGVVGDARTEYSEPLKYTIETGPQKDFPYRLRVNRVHVFATVGAGIVTGDDPTQTDPTIEIECSLDGGLTWCEPRQRPLGRQAVGRQSVNANSFGHATGQGVRWRFSVSDDVDVSIMGASMEVRKLAA